MNNSTAQQKIWCSHNHLTAVYCNLFELWNNLCTYSKGIIQLQKSRTVPHVILSPMWLGIGHCRLSRLNQRLVTVYRRIVSLNVCGCLPSLCILKRFQTEKQTTDMPNKSLLGFSLQYNIHLSVRLVSSSSVFFTTSSNVEIFLNESSSLRDWNI